MPAWCAGRFAVCGWQWPVCDSAGGSEVGPLEAEWSVCVGGVLIGARDGQWWPRFLTGAALVFGLCPVGVVVEVVPRGASARPIVVCSLSEVPAMETVWFGVRDGGGLRREFLVDLVSRELGVAQHTPRRIRVPVLCFVVDLPAFYFWWPM